MHGPSRGCLPVHNDSLLTLRGQSLISSKDEPVFIYSSRSRNVNNCKV
jgi:hypothetical protein